MTRSGAVWIDLTTLSHVPVFRPILRRLADAGMETVVTARDDRPTLALLELHGIPHRVIGRHGDGNLVDRALARRALALVRFGRRLRARQAVSHGSNDLSLAARMLGMHNTVLQDDAHAGLLGRIDLRLASKVMAPAALPLEALRPRGVTEVRYRPYPGIKEQVSLSDFAPDPGILSRLGVDESRPVAVLRPPAGMSLYHRFENPLLNEVLDRLLASEADVILLPRTPEQRSEFAHLVGVTVPDRPVDGPSLIYAADLVIASGGTMNREAALLGTPSWSTTGREPGPVDWLLIESGRLRLLRRADELEIVRRQRAEPQLEPVADAVTAEILAM